MMPTPIKERYEVLELLGVGGEGRVVKALDQRHGRFVTLKIRPARDGQAREELLSEARILLAVPPHPALPLVREDFFDGEDYVVAMDWVEGTDLATLLRDRGRPGLAPSSVLAYLSQAAEALTHLHSQVPPVIHGDVKPANLILTTGGRIKLVDFGISSAPNALRRRVGTPGFRAPELVSDGAPSRASDVYALAATAFTLLTGSAPAGVLPAWEGIDPTQAEQLEAAIRLGMATDPARRPATPGELIERLRAGWAQALPTGVITFCLSDIDGSSAMWSSDPPAMAEALVRHDELIADCVERRGGRFIKSIGEGDATVSVFASATSALEAAVAATRALSAEPWPNDLHVAGRFGLHTGEAERRGADYGGSAIALAAQIRGQAEGGQIILSAVTAPLVAGHLPAGCELVDLGPHRLRGRGEPARIHALKAADIRAPLGATACPYRGLLPFEPEDRDYFFGREQLVEELIGRLKAGRLVAVVGASGSGKSSLLRAGVIAAVRAGEVHDVQRASLIRPGSSPELDLPDDPAVLVVVDQFEELFTLCEDAARRRAFIEALLAVRGPVVIGVRADMYGRLAGHPELARTVAANQVLLVAMSDAELERAVTEPARLAGLRLEPGLVELALRDVAGESGALPLLSHALLATWERRDGRTLTVEGYRETGGVASAIARTADGVLASLPPDRRAVTRSMFLRLTELGDAAAERRRRVNIDELVPDAVSPEVVQALLERLAEARLVTLGEGTAEVAHEVLIREWPTLRGWLDEDRDGIRLHRNLGAAARLWETGGRDSSDLYRGTRLDAAAEWAELHRAELNATERSFVETSLEEAGRERDAQLRANRRLRGLLAGAVALLLVAALAGAVALIQRSHAQAQRSHAQAQALTSDAERVGAQALVEKNLDLAMLYAVTGVKLQNRLETRGDLLEELQNNSFAVRYIRASHNQITSLAVDPSGRLLATSDSAGVVRFEDMSQWRSSGRPVALGGSIPQEAMAFSPDGRTLAVLAEGGTPEGAIQAGSTNLYAIGVATHRARLLGSWSGVFSSVPYPSASLAYDPRGRDIALSISAAARDGSVPADTLRLLDASTGRVIWRRHYPLRAGQQEARVAFVSGATLLTSAQQGDTLLWDTSIGRVTRRFPVGGQPAIAPDGGSVALAVNSPDLGTATARIAMLNLRTGHIRDLPASLSNVWLRGFAFIQDGRTLVGETIHGDVYLWDVASGSILNTIPAPPGARASEVLDPIRRIVLVGSQAGTVVAFDLAGTRRLGKAFVWNPTAFGSCTLCTVVSPQSDLMATENGDGAVALIDLRTLRRTTTLPPRTTTLPPGDGSQSQPFGFSPNGHTLLTGDLAGRLTLWNVAAHSVVRRIKIGAPLYWGALSPNGRLLAVQTQTEQSRTARVQVRTVNGGKPLWTHELQDGTGGLYFSPDGREVAALGCCTSRSTMASWNARTGRKLFETRSLTNHATAIAYSPDSRLLAVGTEDGHVLFWDARSGVAAGQALHVSSGNVAQISFSPDGTMMVVSSFDGSTTLWDLRSRTQIGGSFPERPNTITQPVFEPNGKLLIQYNSDAAQWPTNVASWERFACQVAGRDITLAEWHAVLPTRAYMHVCG
jgi:WD40 repeat protein/class 3 adenylate cyclase/energy-coupling factor transporter ATP-binding protein EcfA2